MSTTFDSLLLSDDEESSEGNHIPAKKARTEYIFLSVEEAIQEECRENIREHNQFRASEITKNTNIIIKFLGDLTYFRDEANQKRDVVQKYILRRVQETFDFSPFAPQPPEAFTQEQENWIGLNISTIVRILYRTFEPISIHSKITGWDSQIVEEKSNYLKFLKNKKFNYELHLQLGIDAPTESSPTPHSSEHDDLCAKITNMAISQGYSAGEVAERLGSLHIGSVVENLEHRQNAPREIFDDPPRQSGEPLEEFINPENLSESRYDSVLEEDDDYVTAPEDNSASEPKADFITEPANESTSVSVTEELDDNSSQPKRGCLKEKGAYYSDKNVYLISLKERLQYASNYKKIKSKKKVTFQDPPDVLLVCTNHAATAIEIHKELTGCAASIGYPLDLVEQEAKLRNRLPPPPKGEAFTTGMQISYDSYRKYYESYIPATALIHYNRRKNQRVPKIIKTRPMRESRGNTDLVQVPAHDGWRDRVPVPLINQNDVLLDYHRKLDRYGNYWGHRGCIGYCYGPMIITDGILEDADPQFLLNTGLFSFPPPFEINWGMDSIVRYSTAEEAVAELMSLHQLISVQMQQKYEDFTNKGYLNLTVPKFWLLTLPILPNSDKDKYKTYNKCVKIYAESRGVHLIDWGRAIINKLGVLGDHNAESQVRCLYEELIDKELIRIYRENEDKVIENQMGRSRTNKLDWIKQREAAKKKARTSTAMTKGASH